jgi:hypothetical protein
MSGAGVTVRVIGIGLLLIGLAFLAELGGLHWFRYFQPKWEDAKHESFKNTRPYNEGKLQELSRYRADYLRSKDPIERAAIASTIRHTFAEYDESRLPRELADFARTCKYGTGTLSPQAEAEGLGSDKIDLNPYTDTE